VGALVKIIGGASASLLALPGQKAAREPSGKLDVHCENRSMVPVDLDVTFLHSSDAAVASVTPAKPSIRIHLARRPNKSFGGTPFIKQQTVGSWQPASSGVASLTAIVTVAPPLVGAGGPTESVSVT